MNKNIAESNLISKLGAKDSILCEASGSLRRVTVEDLSTSLGEIHTSQALKTYWNTGQPSTVLRQSGNRDVLIDYLQACKRYVFNASGTKKAEIAYVEQLEDLGASIVHFVDGYSTTVNALNEAGCNWMTLRPELGFLSTEEDGVPVFYCAGRGSIAGGHSFKKKYVGMFKAYLQGEVLKSQPNRVPTSLRTILSDITASKKLNNQYGLYDYNDWRKDNMIHLSYFGNTNYENNVGTGLITGPSYNVKSGYCLSDMINKIISFGYCPCLDDNGNSANRVHFFGLEGIGEGLFESLNGIVFDGENAYTWDTNKSYAEVAGSEKRTFKRNGSSFSVMKKAIGGEYFDLISSSVTSDSNVLEFFCDANGGIGDSGEVNLAYVFGYNAYGSLCGISCCYIRFLYSHRAGFVVHRLSHFGEPATVGGSDILS